MAKKNGLWKFLLSGGVIFATVITAFVTVRLRADNNTMAIDKLEVQGCIPTQQIPVILYRLNSIDKGMETLSTEQKEMRKESTEGFGKIMERLPK